MKKIYSLLSALMLTATIASAQIPPEISTVWHYSSPGNFALGAVGNFTLLHDSTVAFLSGEFELETHSTRVYLFKAGPDGSHIIDHKRVNLPFDLYAGGDDAKFLNTTPDSALIISLSGSGGMYITKYKDNFDSVGSKYIPVDVRGTGGAEFNAVEVLPSGNIMLTAVLLSSARPVPFSAILVGIDHNGDRLFNADLFSNKLTDLKAGGNNSFAGISKSLLDPTGPSIAFFSGADGSGLGAREVPDNIKIISNIAFQPLTGKYRLVTVDNTKPSGYPGPIDLLFHTFDSNFVYEGSTPYINATNIDGSSLQLAPDREKGFYFWQHIAANSDHKEYVLIGRLDSADKVRWSFRAETPEDIVKGMNKIIPLAGNDFLLVSENNGEHIYRLHTNFPAPDSSAPAPLVATKLSGRKNSTAQLTITTAPNPTTDHFTLVTRSSVDKALTIIVTDVAGRVVERRLNVAANGTVFLGSSLPAGIYFVTVRQEGVVKNLKLIKR
jgi:hypothetical protein